MPHDAFCPRQKNKIQDFLNQRYIGIFMSQRERERASERGRARARGKGKGKKEREYKSTGDYISKPPGPE
jgi:hypothetical protein